MNGLKIGVLTFHNCINYGSFWQAKCLVEGLLARGYDVEILNHHSPRINHAEWKTALQPVLPGETPEVDQALYREKLLKQTCAINALPLSPEFKLEAPAGMPQYDLVIVGSDEVWNLMHPWFGKCPIFYGEGILTKRLVSYAASFGNYPANWGLEPAWAEKLQNFELISVRDENSKQLIQNAIGTDPEIVLDPCLQFEVKPEVRVNGRFPSRYLALYGHSFSASFLNQIRNYAEKLKLPIISIGYRNDWADEQWIAADPHDFVHFISGAEGIATNFFHGCVFALLFGKPFAAEKSPYRSLKLEGLLPMLNAGNHLISETTSAREISKILSESLNPEIGQKIAQLRETSANFLDRALQPKQYQNA
ncbi:polysaccharide pyruvyl transferase family protein [Adhaeribacter soli]|uniref:Polysaccharide pyruvyl transferase family protein n=1 Tax=Adhaeribacter soli TaxID=2607655 RepID=A0A5N1ISA9_9BACT|nr:polysaccharide pyruvyl transferase family protein [Adhaeribacter soli]KAA9332801.1 polysaccharide pyruvyl transferase family protein [Adhaeribacter soli]